ncbi:MAG: tRNA-dihydrouridine synthase family protein [Duodenibacillus sp.]|nr:tRNA-dihydrouridine synthase family protein [Duodenibacillus sp.]
MTDLLNRLRLTAAPMEGITTVVWRRLHAEFFGAADRYYLPFVTPTTEPRFTERQLRELDPRVNGPLTVIPQLLTRRAPDFIWAARALADMGYAEVNLNIGCPAGTVTAKGKGSGFLREPVALAAFLDEVFNAQLPIAVSIKTRIGYADEEEFSDLARLLSSYPVATLTVHPRLKTDLYRGSVRLSVLERSLADITVPLAYNGDIVNEKDVVRMAERFASVPGGLVEVMVGRALTADPALIRKARGGRPASLREITGFMEALLDEYTVHWGNRMNSFKRMKEYWWFVLCMFEEDSAEGRDLGKLAKDMFRARDEARFRALVSELTETHALRTDARYGWFKPA